MHLKYKKFRIGLRTLKTAVAVIISMIIVTFHGATASRLVFAMLGVMAVMEPSLKKSRESCLTQITGMILGGLAGMLLLQFRFLPVAAAGIGIVFVITMYNVAGIRFSPSLPCLIVVTMCTTPDIEPFWYAVGRFWDTAIGLGVGLVINTVVFPYDNSQKIRTAAGYLDKELIRFLENMFDGDQILPDTEEITHTIDNMASQLKIFSKQWILLYRKKNRRQLNAFRICEGKARQLVAQMEVLRRMEVPGRLNDENRKRLEECGAVIRDTRHIDILQEEDIVTNYHVAQILMLRKELTNVLAVMKKAVK